MDHKLAIATVSLGWHESHTLERKLAACQQHGIQGIELVDADLNKYARRHGMTRLQAAESIGQACRDANITIIAYVSFGDFEGHPTPLEARLGKAKEWCEIARKAGTDMIQIPSNFDPDAIGDQEIIVAELQALAGLGSQQHPEIRFAYESLAWGKYAADWEESLRIVQLVDRPNFGLCLDTYHVLARLWADPTVRSGRRPGGNAAVRLSLQRFGTDCPRDKIFYVQLSDAEKAEPSVLPGHPAYKEKEAVLHSWCLYGRIFPFEQEHGAYLPLKEILTAWLLGSGWTGWVSMETFHHSMREAHKGPELWAGRARLSWEKCIEVLREQQQQHI
jgi:sugar phosphate isomerase/epimerase